MFSDLVKDILDLTKLFNYIQDCKEDEIEEEEEEEYIYVS